jgi:lactoylglutathione lyase
MMARQKLALSVLLAVVSIFVAGSFWMTHAQTSWSLKMTAPIEVAISVTDMDKMLKFYVDVLGLKKFGDATVPPEMTTRVGQTPHGLRVVRLLTPYGELLRLIQTGNPPQPSQVPKFVFERHGVVYVSFLVTDIDSIVKRLKENGVTLQSGDAKIEVRPGLFAVYAVDPEGNFVEFLEVPDIAAYRPDLLKWRQFY